jgi:GNAT superfamily N-acetyltransferase
LSDQPAPAPLVRGALPSDAAAIVEFNRRLALETESKVLDDKTLLSGVKRALADPDRLRYWVAQSSDPISIVGQAAITREWSDWRDAWVWWLQSVYVAAPWRGRGVFRALYGQIRAAARAEPDVIGLRLYVEQANHQAHRTYEALGMRPVGYSVYEELWPERLQRPAGEAPSSRTGD